SAENLDFASVQRENPEIERRCQEVIDRCWQMGDKNPIQFIHDVGAGGLSNAFPELVNDGERGGVFELRNVPNDEPGMAPHEIWCNESQERYVMAVPAEKLAQFSAICERERAPFAVVGEATAEPHLSLTDSHFDNQPIDMPLDVLLGKPPKMHRDATTQVVSGTELDLSDVSIDDAVSRILSLPTVADKGFLITIGDRSVTGLVARDQMVGPWQVPVANCAVTAASYDTYAGEAMAMGERSPIALLNFGASARMAVAESITNIASAQIGELSQLQMSANWMSAAGHPGEDAGLYEAVKAIGEELCPALGITIPVGKDSMSMKTQWQQDGEEKTVTSPLTLVMTAFAVVTDIRNTLTPQLRTDQGETKLLLIDLGAGQNRLGGSALAQVYNQLGKDTPDVDSPALLKGMFDAIQTLLAQGKLLAYHDRSDGGLLTTVTEMAFAGNTGVKLELASDSDLLAQLFNEELGCVIQVKAADLVHVTDTLAQYGLSDVSTVIGHVSDDNALTIMANGNAVFSANRRDLRKLWSSTSYQMQKLRDNPSCAEQEYQLKLDDSNPGLHVDLSFDLNQDVAAPFILKGAKPQMAILREQGVNSHVEMAAAFNRAGFNAIDVHMSDVLSGRVSLEQFHGMVACGGFSYGDVLGAGEGWAKSILFNEIARNQFSDFFNRQDTFSLGVCNGCQMLSNLKELIPGTDLWPHFVQNKSERFEARFSLVEVQKSPSVFFDGMAGSRMPIAVSHGEGYAEFGSQQAVDAALNSGTVALQFVDNHGKVTQQYPANPNGSVAGITGLTTNDGRVTIMMPHPERVFRAVANSWHPDDWKEDSPWMRMFRNARVNVG
ncbi:MAG: phosphoribosylformylglycinamidine synthase, partial [Gammaproteobacteria bacterium]|nr:phosphoribosylformylglycinamidine synthase [Gammaproteobacteria bacterium]